MIRVARKLPVEILCLRWTGDNVIEMRGFVGDRGIFYNSVDEDGNLLRTGEVSCETKTAGKYDSVTVYLDDQSETTKFVWITINGLEVFSDADQFVRRMNFEYELMFKFDTESLEIFDVQKSGNNQVDL